MNEAWQLLGKPAVSGVLIVVDHASNHVPSDIALGIDEALLTEHIAWDIGAADIARNLANEHGLGALLGGSSRLVADLNRYPDEAGAIPSISDGIEIPGNILDEEARKHRLDRFFHPYHSKLAEIISEQRPQLILSLHSFTPDLRSRPDEGRPWEIGILYNQDDRASRLALEFLQGQPVFAGDQLPYSGKDLNATMNRHAEANGIDYVGVEIRQDLLAKGTGIVIWSDRLKAMLSYIKRRLPD